MKCCINGPNLERGGPEVGRRAIGIHRAVRNQRRAARSYRDAKLDLEIALKEARAIKNEERLRRSKARRRRILAVRQERRRQLSWPVVQVVFAIKTALLKAAIEWYEWYEAELDFAERHRTIILQREEFTARLDQASLDELVSFFRCGRKIPYRGWEEAEFRRQIQRRPELTIYLCAERSGLVEGPHYHLGNPPEAVRWTTEKLMVVEEIRKRETQQAV